MKRSKITLSGVFIAIVSVLTFDYSQKRIDEQLLYSDNIEALATDPETPVTCQNKQETEIGHSEYTYNNEKYLTITVQVSCEGSGVIPCQSGVYSNTKKI